MGEVHFRISVTHTEPKLCKIYWDFGEEGEGEKKKKYKKQNRKISWHLNICFKHLKNYSSVLI